MRMSGNLMAIWLGRGDSQLATWLRNCLLVSRWMGGTLDLGVLPWQQTALPEAMRLVLAKHRGKDRVRVQPILIRDAYQDVVRAVRERHIELVCLPHADDWKLRMSRRESVDMRSLLQALRVPVGVFPVSVSLADTPFASIVVPMSGELKESQALKLALDVAKAKGLSVEVVHISPDVCGADASQLESTGDEMQHEYAANIDQLMAKVSPYSSSRHKLSIRKFHHCCGDVFTEIQRVSGESAHPLLVLEWSGSFAGEHALTIRKFVEETDASMILLKSPPGSRSTLKVGGQFNMKSRRVSSQGRGAQVNSSRRHGLDMHHEH